MLRVMQGLAGAVYGLYQGDTLVASYTTDAEGSFISDYFICDSDWTLREISLRKDIF